MLKIDMKNGLLEPTLGQTLEEAGLKETPHFQDLIRRNSKPFFDEIGLDNAVLLGTEIKPADEIVDDRIDLLAVDRDGTITVIELKRGSNKLHLLQAISYAAMIASWQPDDFEGLLQNREDLDEGAKINNAQRVVLVADAFQYEVLITAEWLVSKCENLDIRCIRVEVAKYPSTNSEYLTCEQVYPLPEIADHAVRRRGKKGGVNLRPKTEGEILKSTTNDDVYAFFDEQRKKVLFDENHKSLRFEVGPRIAWSVSMRRAFASVWQYRRFAGDLEFWGQRLSNPKTVGARDEGRALTFHLENKQDFANSWTLVRLPPGSIGRARSHILNPGPRVRSGSNSQGK